MTQDEPPIEDISADGAVRRRVVAALGMGALGAVSARLIQIATSDVSSDGPTQTLESTTTTDASATTSTPTSSISSSEAPTTTEAVLATTEQPELIQPSDSSSTSVSLASVTTVAVVCRQAWGARPALAGAVDHVPVRLTLHHTAVVQADLSQGPSRVRQHQNHHLSLGWPDLAYHFVVDRTGTAFEGRDLRHRGDTGTEYDPDGHFLVCMEGNFDQQTPTDAQIETTLKLFAWGAGAFSIDPHTIAGHSTYAATSCPGTAVVELLPAMGDLIAGVGDIDLEVICGDDGAALVASIESSR